MDRLHPVRAKLANDPVNYRFSTLPVLLGKYRSIIPLEPDDTLFENFESSMGWLCQAQKEQQVEDIRRALRRKTFQLPRNETTKGLNVLETSESIPKR
jgi:hypothetical protein